MQPSVHRVVFDTNILLRALVAENSLSSRLLILAETRQLIIVLSRPLVAEYRQVLAAPETIRRFPQLSPARVERTLARLRYMGDSVAVTDRFRFVRDPHDAKLLELSISGRVTHLLTADRDLLDLGSGIDEAAKRFRTRLRQLLILTPEQYFTNYLS